MIKTLLLSFLLLLSLAPDGNALTTHVIKFYVHPDVVAVTSLTSVKDNLVKYVADMNVILAKNTDHALSFTPSTGVISTSAQPHDNIEPAGGAPRFNYEIWVRIIKSPTTTSYAGYAGFNSSGAAVMGAMSFTRIWNPSTATGASLEDYENQLMHLMHVYAQGFGASVATGNYWNLWFFTDNTFVSPTQNAAMFSGFFPLIPNLSDPYWGSRSDYLTDPSTIIHPHSTRAQILAYYRFSGLSSQIIRENYRLGVNRPPMSSLDSLQITVKDSETCRPVDGVFISVWGIRSSVAARFLGGANTTGGGLFYWDWNSLGGNPIASDQVRLFKLSCPGYESKSFYITSLDMQSAAVIDLLPRLLTETSLKRVSRPTLSMTGPGKTVTVSNIVAGQPFKLQASVDLQNWITVATVNPTSSANFTYLQTLGDPPVFFYRTQEDKLCGVQ